MTTTHSSPPAAGPHAAFGLLMTLVLWAAGLMGSSNGELQDCTNGLIDLEKTYGLEVSIEKKK